MIDTVQCFGDKYKIVDWSKWNTHSITNGATGEIKEKAVSNSGNISATMYGSRLIFHTSIPKLLYGTNIFELKQSDTDRAMEKLQFELRESCGVQVADRLRNFKLSRIDFCKNIQVQHSIIDYIQALSELRYSRRDKAIYKSQTLSFRNSRRELTFYDKILEARQDKKLSPELSEYVNSIDNNLLRVEAKLRRASVVNREFGHKELSEILSSELSTKKLCTEFDGLVKSDTEQLEFNFTGNKELIELLQRKHSRGAISRFLEVKGTATLLAELNYDWSVVKELLLSVKVSERTAFRYIERLRQNQSILNIERNRKLLTEIRQKLSIRLVA